MTVTDGGRTISQGKRRRKQATLTAGLILGGIIAWTILMLATGTGSPGLLTPHSLPRGASGFSITVAMWMVMMVAMMTPGLLPWLTLHTRMDDHSGYETGTMFLTGYFTAWLGYSVAGASLQLALQASGAFSPDLRLATPLGGLTLVLAGLYQFTPLKGSCLSRCRNPLSFLLSHWRDGPAGAFSLGLRHGIHCVGCCWGLMALGFALGLMNLVWMAAITAVVSLEQLVSRGPTIGRLAGVLLIAWGVVLLVR